MKLKELLNIMGTIASERKYSQPFICGGTPRDKYLKRLDNVNDLDITTGNKTIHALAKDTSKVLSAKYQISTKFADDGHTSIHIGDLKIDFSTNFVVPEIEKILLARGIIKPTEMQKELYSRDFTCNALLMSFDLKTIIDPLNRGLKDIQNKKIVCCLDPSITFTTNKNRVVRAIYLSAKLGFDIDEKIIKWVSEHPESIRFGSERSLTQKLNKALDYNPEKTIKLLGIMNLWNHIPISERLYPYYIKRLKEGK